MNESCKAFEARSIEHSCMKQTLGKLDLISIADTLHSEPFFISSVCQKLNSLVI